MIDRRSFCALGLTAIATSLAGCADMQATLPFGGGLFGGEPSRSGDTLSRPDYASIYGAYDGEAYPIPPIAYSRIKPEFLRQDVAYLGPEPAGTVVVEPSTRHLYFVEGGGRATRYGVGVGREGFAWSGSARINMRRSWPDWIPPHEMVARLPDIRAQLEPTPRGMGVRGGPRSPLGARAMYLYGLNGGDLGYRIHGTTEPYTVGTNVSSGCVRMINQDIVHLYGRAPDGTRVVVLG